MWRNITPYGNSRYHTCLIQYVSKIVLLVLIQLVILIQNEYIIRSVAATSTDYTTSSSQCGQAYIGNITCGIVNAVTSIDIILYPPQETIYEVSMSWTKVTTKSGYYYKSNNNNQNQPDTITTYYSNITSVKNISLSVMFSEPDTQSLTISILGFNDNYVTGDDTYTNNKWRDDEACYNIQKPSTTTSSSSTSTSTSTTGSTSSNSWIVHTTKYSCYVTEPLSVSSSSSSSSYSLTQPTVSSSSMSTNSTTSSNSYLYMNSICIMIGISFCIITIAMYIATRLRRYHHNKKQIQQVSKDQLIDNYDANIK